MRRQAWVLWLAIVAALGCRQRPKVCPDGFALKQQDPDGKSLWCASHDGAAAQWIELWGPGDRRLVCRYKNGRPEGSFLAWHKGGLRWVEGQYRDGEKTGTWTQWDTRGDKVGVGDYREGGLVRGAPVGLVALCEQKKQP